MYTEYNYLYTSITESLIIVCVTNDIITHLSIRIIVSIPKYNYSYNYTYHIIGMIV